MQRMDRHHVVPLSLGGHDNDENVTHLTDAEHRVVHDTLAVPYQSIRTFRKRTNHIYFANEYYVRELAILQLMYFEKIGTLSEYLIRLHRISIENQVHQLLRWYSIRDFQFAYTKNKNEAEKFMYYLKAYHSVLLIYVLREQRKFNFNNRK